MGYLRTNGARNLAILGISGNGQIAAKTVHRGMQFQREGIHPAIDAPFPTLLYQIRVATLKTSLNISLSKRFIKSV